MRVVRRGNRDWTSVSLEVHILKRLKEYKKTNKLHSNGEAIEKLLDEEEKE